MPDLLRRVALLTLVSSIGIGMLAPLATRSATPISVSSRRLLAAAGSPLSLGDRAGAEGRERSAALSLAAVAPPIGPEELGDNAALATPPSAPMEATLYRSTAAAAPAPAPAGDISGTGTWYCCSRGWTGVAVVALPGALGGHYQAPPATRFVTVCADRCALLPVVDYCGCLWDTPSQRVAYLSPEAWALVTDTPQSRGVISVTVHLAG